MLYEITIRCIGLSFDPRVGVSCLIARTVPNFFIIILEIITNCQRDMWQAKKVLKRRITIRSDA